MIPEPCQFNLILYYKPSRKPNKPLIVNIDMFGWFRVYSVNLMGFTFHQIKNL